MTGTITRRMTTRRAARSEVERKADDARKKREAKLFQIPKVIGPNDLVVNRKLGKIKVEELEEKVKPELEEEPEVKMTTVTEEIDLDVEEGLSEPILLLPGYYGGQTGSLAGLKTEDKVKQGTNSGEKSMADLHREIKSLRKQLSAATSNQIKAGSSSSGVKLLESKVAELIAENEAQRQKIVTLNELIVEYTLENRRLRKKCNEAPAAPVSLGESSGSFTTVETRVGRPVGDEMHEVKVRIVTEEIGMDTEEGPSELAFASTQDTDSGAETRTDLRREIESHRKQLNEATSTQTKGASSPKVEALESKIANLTAENEAQRQEILSLKKVIANQNMEIQQLRKDKPVSATTSSKSFQDGENVGSHVDQLDREQQSHRKILRPRPARPRPNAKSLSLGKHPEQFHDDDKPNGSQQINEKVAQIEGTFKKLVLKLVRVDETPEHVQRLRTSIGTLTRPRSTLIWKCPRCSLQFNCKDSLQKHIRNHDLWQCQLCLKVIWKLYNLRRHVTHIHPGYNYHLMIPTKFKPFKCDHDQCSSRHDTMKELKVHKKLHEDPSAYRCHTCKIDFRSPGALGYHKKRYHPTKTNPQKM